MTLTFRTPEGFDSNLAKDYSIKLIARAYNHYTKSDEIFAVVMHHAPENVAKLYVIVVDQNHSAANYVSIPLNSLGTAVNLIQMLHEGELNCSY
jgi:hypothetical protein